MQPLTRRTVARQRFSPSDRRSMERTLLSLTPNYIDLPDQWAERIEQNIPDSPKLVNLVKKHVDTLMDGNVRAMLHRFDCLQSELTVQAKTVPDIVAWFNNLVPLGLVRENAGQVERTMKRLSATINMDAARTLGALVQQLTEPGVPIGESLAEDSYYIVEYGPAILEAALQVFGADARLIPRSFDDYAKSVDTLADKFSELMRHIRVSSDSYKKSKPFYDRRRDTSPRFFMLSNARPGEKNEDSVNAGKIAPALSVVMWITALLGLIGIASAGYVVAGGDLNELMIAAYEHTSGVYLVAKEFLAAAGDYTAVVKDIATENSVTTSLMNKATEIIDTVNSVGGTADAQSRSTIRQANYAAAAMVSREAGTSMLRAASTNIVLIWGAFAVGLALQQYKIKAQERAIESMNQRLLTQSGRMKANITDLREQLKEMGVKQGKLADELSRNRSAPIVRTKNPTRPARPSRVTEPVKLPNLNPRAGATNSFRTRRVSRPVSEINPDFPQE